MATDSPEVIDEAPDDEYWEQQIARDEAMYELAAAPSTWKPFPKYMIDSAIGAGPQQTAPTLFVRTDDVPLVYPGRINMFLGETEGCKTWAALWVVAQEIRKGYAALYVDLEDELTTAVERLKAFGLSNDEIRNGLLYATPDTRFDETAKAWWTLRDQGFQENDRVLTVAVFDSVTEIMGIYDLDPNSGRDVVHFYKDAPGWFSHDGVAVIVVDHAVKDRSAQGRHAIGSERKLSGLTGAAYKFVCEESFGRGKTGKVKLTVSKDRPGYVGTYEANKSRRDIATLVLVSAEDGSVTCSLEPPQPKTVKEAVQDLKANDAETVRAVRENPGLSKTELRPLLSIKGGSKPKDDSLNRCVADKKLRTEKASRKILYYVA